MDRRDFMKKAALASACSAAAALVPGVTFGSVQDVGQAGSGLQWKKAPCRFCGSEVRLGFLFSGVTSPRCT